MTPRRKFITAALVLASLVVLAGSAVLTGHLKRVSDQMLHITPETLAKLDALRHRPKYVDEPGTIYNGMRPEGLRVASEAQLNHLIDRLRQRVEARPSKKVVLQEIARTLDEFQGVDTEDRERICRYAEELMDIFGIESSDGLLNRFLYGPILGTILQWLPLK